MSKPLVSVIIRCYNQAEFIEQAVASVTSQAYSNLEIIIIDDCSLDNSKKIIQCLAKMDTRIKPIFNLTNQGNARTLNIALYSCTGKYIANLDGDDLWLSQDKISEQFNFLENNLDYVLVGSFVQNINEAGQPLKRYSFPLNDTEIKNALLKRNPIAASSVLFRRKTAIKVEGYPEDRRTSDDIGLWLKLGIHGKFHNLPFFWHAHRITSFNIGEVQRKQQAKDTLYYVKKYKKNYTGYPKAWLIYNYYILIFSLPYSVINFLRKVKNSI